MAGERWKGIWGRGVEDGTRGNRREENREKTERGRRREKRKEMGMWKDRRGWDRGKSERGIKKGLGRKKEAVRRNL